MANKLSTILTEIKTALTAALTTGGTPILKKFEYGLLYPDKVKDFPAMGMVIDSTTRASGSIWTTPILFPFVVRQGDSRDINKTITDVAIEIIAALDAWQAADRSNGGSIENTSFDVWWHPQFNPLAPIGGVIRVVLTVEGPLKTT